MSGSNGTHPSETNVRVDSDLYNGAEFDFGSIRFSTAEIIEFATKYDPLDFHLSREAARQHFFKDIVASGPQPFHHFYVHHWIPKFRKSILCGLGVDNWKFLKPVYADELVTCRVVITDLMAHPEKNSASIRWNFNFFNVENELYQHLEMLVLHRLNY